MAELTTETPTTPTEGSTSSEAAPTSLLTSAEVEATTTAAASTETTTEGDKPAAEVKTEEKPAGAPESYDFKAPEGKEYDSAVLEPFAAAAKKANMSQESAQEFLDSMAPALAERQQAQIKAVQDGWLEATKTDKEIGGEKLQENLGIAKKALDQFDPIPTGETTTELRTLLNSSGLGNNPTVLKFFFRAGKAMSEDTFVSGGAPKGPADITKSLYPNTPSKEK